MNSPNNPISNLGKLLVFFAVLWFFSSSPEANAELVQRGEWRRPYEASKARAVTAQGNWAYILTHELNFRVFDISNPDDLKFTGRTVLSADPTIRYAWDLAIKGDYVYAVLGGDVHVIDVRNKSAPWKVSNFGMAAALSIEIEGDIAYVGALNAFYVFSVVDPLQPPRLLGSYTVSTTTFNQMVAMDVSNGLAYCVIQVGLLILDVSDPRSPARVGGIDNPPQSITTDVSVVGNLAYATINGRVAVYDVSNPAAPQTVHTGNYLGANALVISGTTLLYKTIDSFGFGDLSNATLPVFDVPQSFADIGAVGVDGSRLFAAGNSLLSFEAGPGLPTQRASHAASGSPVGSSDGVMYLAASRCFPVIDFSDPANPFVVRVVNTRGGTLTVRGNRLYSKGECLEIFDRSDPRHPRLLGSVRPVSAHAAAYSDTRAYVLGNQSVEIFDVTDAAAPRSISTFPFTGNAYWIATVGDFVVLGTFVFDARNPYNVVHAAEIPYYAKIQGYGNLLFGQEGESDLRITDLSNPYSPAPVGVFHWQTWNGFEALSAESEICAVSRAQGRVEVADIRRPATPAFVGYAPSIRFSQPSVAGRNVFVVTADGIALWEAILPDLPTLPELSILRSANFVVIRWPATFTGAKLYSVENFGDEWRLVTESPAQDGASFTYTNRFPFTASQFYTLRP